MQAAAPTDTRDDQKILDDLRRVCPRDVRIGEPMGKHTTIAAGGKARFLTVPRTTGQVIALVRTALKWDLPYVGVGRGSNLLVRDGGFDGIVIKVASNLNRIRVYRQTAYAEAGVSFTRLGRVLTKEGRPGFEFAVGIPGSVGGAVRMNAGAYGSEVARVLKSARVVDGSGRVAVLPAAQLAFGYRESALPPGSIVLSATFNCPSGEIDQVTLARSLSRKETQPLWQPSFGSTFRNPPGAFAGELIDTCGLKGTRVGGAMISDKHANFIVNLGEETRANDIEDLIKLVIERVRERHGIVLRPEVVIIGDR